MEVDVFSESNKQDKFFKSSQNDEICMTLFLIFWTFFGFELLSIKIWLEYTLFKNLKRRRSMMKSFR